MTELPNPQRWELVREIFGGALELDSEDWGPYLRHACEGDREVRIEVESLLEAHRAGGDFLTESSSADGVPAALGLEPADDLDDALDGQFLGPYKIEGRIGGGGMGEVYTAVRADSVFDKRVAIKLLKRGMDSAEIVRRFQAERQILAGLEHPNIARLLDGGTADDGRPYLVMEHVEGLPIDEYCNVRRLSVSERLELFRKVCTAIQLAHGNLVVHRALKPSNILVTDEGEPKLLDFGIAKILDPLSSGTAAATQTLMRLMTPDYASPEQILGTPVTTASDIYALGVLLYLLLTGSHPSKRESRSPLDMLWAIHGQTPEPPSRAVKRALAAGPGTTPREPIRHGLGDHRRLSRRLAGDLDNIVLKALRKEPERRYATVDQLSEDLRRHLEGRPISAGPDSLRYRCGKFVRRHRLGVLTAVMFFIAVLGFGILMAIQRSQVVRERDRLDRQRLATETERLRAERVTTFLIDLFEASDPFGQVDAGDVTVRALLDRGAERLSALDGQPEVQADLGHTVGVIYRRLGAFAEASPLLDAAHDTRRRHLPGDHPKLADSLSERGLLRQGEGDYPTARELFEEALAMRRRLFGEHHPATADSLSHLAGLAWALGDFPEAERQQRQALEVYRQQLGTDSTAVANSLHWLALILQSQGDHDGATRAYDETLSIQRRLLGDDHIEVAATRANLAHLLLRQHELDRAEPLYRQALATLRRRFGDDHVQVALCVRGLAEVLAAKGDTQSAESHYRQALDLLRRLRGPDHPDLSAALDGLARVHLAAGNYREAERAYREALEIRRKTLGEDSPYLVISLTGLARVVIEQGDYTSGEGLLHQALEIGRRAFPGGHWRIDMAQSLLGECRIATGRYAQAEPLLLESHRALTSRRGANAPVTLTALDRLVRLYDAWDRPREAARLRTERGRLTEPPATS